MKPKFSIQKSNIDSGILLVTRIDKPQMALPFPAALVDETELTEIVVKCNEDPTVWDKYIEVPKSEYIG